MQHTETTRWLLTCFSSCGMSFKHWSIFSSNYKRILKLELKVYVYSFMPLMECVWHVIPNSLSTNVILMCSFILRLYNSVNIITMLPSSSVEYMFIYMYLHALSCSRRPDALPVMVYLTDGKSNQPVETVEALRVRRTRFIITLQIYQLYIET